jgi:hypothetical protein
LFFPALIYTILQAANCKFLKSNLVYIKSFRVELQGQEEYYITAMESALEFLSDLKQSDLKMSEREAQNFDRICNG